MNLVNLFANLQFVIDNKVTIPWQWEPWLMLANLSLLFSQPVLLSRMARTTLLTPTLPDLFYFLTAQNSMPVTADPI